MPLQKLEFKAGLNREGTDYSNKGGWYDGDKIRFRSGFPEKIGGWTQVSPNQFLGYARSLWNWEALSGALYLGVGTDIKYYIYYGGIYNDITPVSNTNTYTATAGTISTINGSNIVTITDPNYQPGIGSYVIINSTTAVNGVMFTGLEYIVLSTPTSTTYTVAYGANASATGSGTGGTVTLQYEYPIGTNNTVTGTGWGTGPWGGSNGNFVTLTNPFTTTNGSSAITVTQNGHGYVNGQYIAFLGASAVGGILASQINNTFIISGVTTNTYTITLPTGLTATSSVTGGGTVTVRPPLGTFLGVTGLSSTGSAVTLSFVTQATAPFVVGSTINVTNINPTSYNGIYVVTACTTTSVTFSSTNTATYVSGGYINNGRGWSTSYSSGASTQIRIWTNDNYGQDLVISPRGGPIYYWQASAGLATRAQSLQTLATNAGYLGAYVPNSTNQVITSAIQQFVIAFGANSYVSGTPNTPFNPMLVRWSDQSNAYQWVPAVTNQSGEFPLTNGSYIVGSRATRQEILIWTDSALYSMQYIGAPYVWGFNILMDNISIMGPNAMITVNNITYWMGQGKFYMYTGTVQTLPCTLRQYIFDDININQNFQVFAGANEGFNEIWWFYVSNESSNNTVDKYVIYNYVDQVWSYGTMARTAWIDTAIRGYPIAADYNRRLLYHENGVDDVSTSSPQPITAYVQSSDFDIGVGQSFGFVWRMLPDINFNGSNIANPSVTVQLLPRQNSGSPYGTAASPTVKSAQVYASPTPQEYTIQQFTGEVFTRLRGRQISYIVKSTGLGVTWQSGTSRLDIKPDGRR